MRGIACLGMQMKPPYIAFGNWQMQFSTLIQRGMKACQSSTKREQKKKSFRCC
jgi:hypothetical protein